MSNPRQQPQTTKRKMLFHREGIWRGARRPHPRGSPSPSIPPRGRESEGGDAARAGDPNLSSQSPVCSDSDPRSTGSREWSTEAGGQTHPYATHALRERKRDRRYLTGGVEDGIFPDTQRRPCAAGRPSPVTSRALSPVKREGAQRAAVSLLTWCHIDPATYRVARRMEAARRESMYRHACQCVSEEQ